MVMFMFLVGLALCGVLYYRADSEDRWVVRRGLVIFSTIGVVFTTFMLGLVLVAQLIKGVI